MNTVRNTVLLYQKKMKKPYKYKLPKGFKIADSPIKGQGLFSTHNRAKGKIIGEGEHPSHVHDKRFADSFIRTALGTFINHSEEPNCELVLIDDAFYLKTIKKIRVGDEMTIKPERLGMFDEFYKLTPAQIAEHNRMMSAAKDKVIDDAKIWVEAKDKEKVRLLGEDILNGAIVMNAWDTNVRSVFLWFSVNGWGAQQDAASKWLNNHP